MITNEQAINNSQELIHLEAIEKVSISKNEKTKAFAELEQAVHAALETYSNVHRGSGHFSMVSTHLFEQARDIVLEYLELNNGKYMVVFCTPLRASMLAKQVNSDSYQLISSRDIGLSLGVVAVAIKEKDLSKIVHFHTGGGTSRLISKTWIVWASKPDRYEAGTPAIINIIAFAKSLLLIKKYGKGIFDDAEHNNLSTTELLFHDELEKYSGLELLKQLRLTLIGRGVQVPTTQGTKPFVNLDNSASTPTFAPVWNVFRQALIIPENAKQQIIQEVKSIISNMLNAPLPKYDVVFTSNTTEAINLAAESLGYSQNPDIEPVVVNTIMEHSSNDLPWRMVPNASIIRLSVDSEGFVDVDELENLLVSYNQKHEFGKKRIGLIAISGASNVLGICNKIAVISSIVHQYGAKLLVDAAQLVAHRKIDMEGCMIDYLAFSAHKVYAPFGCGVLMARKGILNFNPSDLENIRLSGEENVAGIAALGKALLLLQRIGMENIQHEEQHLTAYALNALSQVEGLKVYGVKNTKSDGFADKLGVILFGFKSTMASKVANELALLGGIGVRSGCHCAHIIVKHMLNIPPFLEKFQRLIVILFPKLRLPGLTRVSIGLENSEEDVDKLIAILGNITRNDQTIKNQGQTSDNKNINVVSHKIIQKQMTKFVKQASLGVYNQ